MKRFLIIVAIFMVAFCALGDGGKLDAIKLQVNNAPSNTATVAAEEFTNGIPLYGWIDGLILDFSGYASPTVDVDIVTVSGIGGLVERTVYSKDSVTVADEGYIPIRVPVVTTAGVAFSGTTTNVTLIPLVGDKLILKVYDANTNDIIDTDITVVIKE